MPVSDLVKHDWPLPGEHLFGPWLTMTGMPKATQYRVCIHPECRHVEKRMAPNA